MAEARCRALGTANRPKVRACDAYRTRRCVFAIVAVLGGLTRDLISVQLCPVRARRLFGSPTRRLAYAGKAGIRHKPAVPGRSVSGCVTITTKAPTISTPSPTARTSISRTSHRAKWRAPSSVIRVSRYGTSVTRSSGSSACYWDGVSVTSSASSRDEPEIALVVAGEPWVEGI